MFFRFSYEKTVGGIWTYRLEIKVKFGAYVIYVRGLSVYLRHTACPRERKISKGVRRREGVERMTELIGKFELRCEEKVKALLKA